MNTMKPLTAGIGSDEYEQRVTALETQGMTRSDAQAAVDAGIFIGEAACSPAEAEAIEALRALDECARRAVIEEVLSEGELEALAESWFNIDR